MSLLKTIIEAQGGKVLQQVAQQFGLDASQATSAIGNLLPALTRHMKGNIKDDNGLEGLVNAIKNGNHERYLDEPSLFGSEETVRDGNGMLGHILGSKQVSRQVAADAAKKTGLDVSMLKKLLPMVAAMTMGGIKKQSQSSGGLGSLLESLGGSPKAAEQRKGGLDGLLGNLLDADNDGSVVDDLMGMAKKFF